MRLTHWRCVRPCGTVGNGFEDYDDALVNVHWRGGEVRRPNDGLTEKNKAELYARDAYAFKPPPVCCTGWTDADWIRYVDKHGRWTP